MAPLVNKLAQQAATTETTTLYQPKQTNLSLSRIFNCTCDCFNPACLYACVSLLLLPSWFSFEFWFQFSPHSRLRVKSSPHTCMRSFLLIFVAIAAVNFQVRAASSDLELEFPTPQQTPQVSLVWRRLLPWRLLQFGGAGLLLSLTLMMLMQRKRRWRIQQLQLK